MISPKRLLQMARKRQKMAAIGRRRISWLKPGDNMSSDMCSTLPTSKGNFVVYSQDGRQFFVDGPIVIPCDAVLMEYVITLLHRRVPKDVEKALLSTIAATQCSTYSTCCEGFVHQQLLVQGFDDWL